MKTTSASRPLRHVSLILVSFVAIFPFLWMLSTSLKSQNEVFELIPQLVPKAWRFENYADVLDFIPFTRMYLNTIVVSIARVAGEVVFAALAGYAFAQLRFPGRNILFIMVLAILMVPVQVTMVPNYVLLQNLGWLDTYQGLIVPRLFSAFGMFLFRQFFMTMPRELIDAARIDGCNPFQTFRFVALPLAKPIIAAFGFLSFLYAWNDFLWPLIVVSSMDMNVLSVGISFFQGQNIANVPLMMAASTMAIMPIVVIFAVAQRHFVEGITLTGLK
jgi:multiple sugar transport system permease protein